MTDPRLVVGPWGCLDPAGRERLDATVAALGSPGVYGLPTVGALPPAVVARWVYRKWMPVGEDLPFLHLDARHLGGGREPRPTGASRLEAALARARDGVVCLEGPVDRGELAALALAHHVRVLVPDGAFVPMGVDEEAWALDLDALHAVALDPTLEDVRGMLLGLCAEGRVVEIHGPPRLGAARCGRVGARRFGERRAAVGAARG